MQRRFSVWSCLLLSGVAVAQAQSPATQTVNADIPGIVKSGTPIVLVRAGLTAGSDDPIGLPDGSLLFTEPNANRVSKVGADGQISTFLENTYGGLAMSFDPQGRLIQAQSEDGHTGIHRIYPKNSEGVIADNYQKRPFNRPNDAIADKKGGVYFTDPGVNGQQRADLEKAQAGRPLAPRLPAAVYYVRPGGEVIRIAEGIERPNGITLSRDEKTLYVNNTNGVDMWAFDIQADGSVRNQRKLATYEGRSKIPNGIPGVMSGADGLTIDNEGRLYAVTSAGIEIFTAKGTRLGTIRMSCGGNDCQGLAFAGPEKKTLYVAGRGSLWKVQLLASGFTGRAK